MQRILKIAAVLLVAEIAAAVVNYATDSHLGSWLVGVGFVYWVTS